MLHPSERKDSWDGWKDTTLQTHLNNFDHRIGMDAEKCTFASGPVHFLLPGTERSLLFGTHPAEVGKQDLCEVRSRFGEEPQQAGG